MRVAVVEGQSGLGSVFAGAAWANSKRSVGKAESPASATQSIGFGLFCTVWITVLSDREGNHADALKGADHQLAQKTDVSVNSTTYVESAAH